MCCVGLELNTSLSSPELIRQLQQGSTETYAKIFTDNSFMIKHTHVTHSRKVCRGGVVRQPYFAADSLNSSQSSPSMQGTDVEIIFPKQTWFARVSAAVSVEVKRIALTGLAIKRLCWHCYGLSISQLWVRYWQIDAFINKYRCIKILSTPIWKMSSEVQHSYHIIHVEYCFNPQYTQYG